MTNIYCGNNSLHKGLQNGTKRLGTRYQCFRRGIGVGLNTPLTGDEDLEFSPIYDQGLYCGKNDIKPRGYKKLGLPFQCLQKGVGVGKSIQLSRNYSFSFGDFNKNNYFRYILVFSISFIITLILLLLIKPKCIYPKKIKKKISLIRLISFSVFVGLLSIFIILI